MSYEENIKFRGEMDRELTISQIDNNFKYVANPWDSDRSYLKGMIVYINYDEEITGVTSVTGGTGIHWFIATQNATRGSFLTTEWDVFGEGSLIVTASNTFTNLIVNSTQVGAFSTGTNADISASTSEIIRFINGSGMDIKHDVSTNLVKFETDVQVSFNTSTFDLTVDGNTVSLSVLAGGYWTGGVSGGVYTVTDSVGIKTEPSTELDVNGDLRVRGISASTADKVAVWDADVIGYRDINADVWTSSNIVTGSGTEFKVPRWTTGGEIVVDSLITDTGTAVGINVGSPNEILDVGGAIKIGSASLSTPTVGSIRYSSDNFYGYTSVSGWMSLTGSATGTGTSGYSGQSGYSGSSVDDWTVIKVGDYNSSPTKDFEIVMTVDMTATLIPGTALQYRTAGAIGYAIVDSCTSILLTIAGRDLSVAPSSLTELYYSDAPGRVSREYFQIPDDWADTSNNTLLNDDVKMTGGYHWQESKAYLVLVSALTYADDTAATIQPTMNVSINGSVSYVLTTSLVTSDTTLKDSIGLINSTNYDINYGEKLEIACQNAGTGTPARDGDTLNVWLTFVRP